MFSLMSSKKMVRTMSFLMVFVLLAVVLVQDVTFAAGSDINTELNNVKDQIINFLKSIARTVAIIMVAVAGFILLFKSGEPDAMRWLKSTAIVFLVAIGVVFLAEPIANGILNLFPGGQTVNGTTTGNGATTGR